MARPQLLAKGGKGGLGNIHFKSSTNRAPRQCTPGTSRARAATFKLELKVLADVGLLGMPNAGKSTFIRAVSAARPKVADYPFTTLHPNLGVVRVDEGRSFVVADIPGLIEGAAEGAGLGHQFLRHLQRTRLLLHLVDIAPLDEWRDPVHDARAIVEELRKYDEALYRKPRWLVLNKVDLLAPEDRERGCDAFLSGYRKSVGGAGENLYHLGAHRRRLPRADLRDHGVPGAPMPASSPRKPQNVTEHQDGRVTIHSWIPSPPQQAAWSSRSAAAWSPTRARGWTTPRSRAGRSRSPS